MGPVLAPSQPQPQVRGVRHEIAFFASLVAGAALAAAEVATLAHCVLIAGHVPPRA